MSCWVRLCDLDGRLTGECLSGVIWKWVRDAGLIGTPCTKMGGSSDARTSCSPAQPLWRFDVPKTTLMRTCANSTCSVEFDPYRPHHVYCSAACRPSKRFTPAPCDVCGKVGRTKKGLCNLHYKRMQRHIKVVTMQVCADPSCETEFSPQGRKVYCSPSCGYSPCDACGRIERLVGGLCRKHYEQIRKQGEIAATEPPKYRTVHGWLRTRRGRATDHSCAICGKPARDWAFDNQEPSWSEPISGRPYHEDLDRYRPLCRNCHRREDGLPACPHGDGPEKDSRGRCKRCAFDREERERFRNSAAVVY